MARRRLAAVRAALRTDLVPLAEVNDLGVLPAPERVRIAQDARVRLEYIGGDLSADRAAVRWHDVEQLDNYRWRQRAERNGRWPLGGRASPDAQYRKTSVRLPLSWGELAALGLPADRGAVTAEWDAVDGEEVGAAMLEAARAGAEGWIALGHDHPSPPEALSRGDLGAALVRLTNTVNWLRGNARDHPELPWFEAQARRYWLHLALRAWTSFLDGDDDNQRLLRVVKVAASEHRLSEAAASGRGVGRAREGEHDAAISFLVGHGKTSPSEIARILGLQGSEDTIRKAIARLARAEKR